jgi:hypothetical protein
LSNYDDEVLGVGNFLHPANEKEIEPEYVSLKEAIYDLADRLPEELRGIGSKIIELVNYDAQILSEIRNKAKNVNIPLYNKLRTLHL